MFKQSSTFDRLLEKSTSQLLLEPDWDAILQICDSIRQGDVTPKYAIAAMQKKSTHENPNIQMLALTVIEAVVKNCGAPVHAQIATRAFMDFFQVRRCGYCLRLNVKIRIYEVIFNRLVGSSTHPHLAY